MHAYSGGLDTTLCIKWLQHEMDLDVIAMLGNVGQEHDGLEKVAEKARMLGCVAVEVVDMTKEFASDYITCAIAANALDPSLKVIAPVREWDLGMRPDEIAYAEKHGEPVSQSIEKPYSIDDNLWGRAIEAGVLIPSTITCGAAPSRPVCSRIRGRSPRRISGR